MGGAEEKATQPEPLLGRDQRARKKVYCDLPGCMRRPKQHAVHHVECDLGSTGMVTHYAVL